MDTMKAITIKEKVLEEREVSYNKMLVWQNNMVAACKEFLKEVEEHKTLVGQETSEENAMKMIQRAQRMYGGARDCLAMIKGGHSEFCTHDMLVKQIDAILER